MLENIVRHIERACAVREAAFRGRAEIGFTIMSMTLSLVAVFIPVLFMGGILGRLLHEFAVTITASILISGLVSLTLTPMLCSRFLQAARDASVSGRSCYQPAFPVERAAFDRMHGFYERTLAFALRHRLLTVRHLRALMAVLTGVLASCMPTGFIPTDDTGIVWVNTEGAQDISFAEMVKHQQAAAAIVAQQPDVDAFMSAMGAGGSSADHQPGPHVHAVQTDARPAPMRTRSCTICARNSRSFRA